MSMQIVDMLVNKIIFAQDNLREVDVEDADYIGLVADISKSGVKNAIHVSPTDDPEVFVLNTGRHRLTAVRQLQWPTIPAVIDAVLSPVERLLDQIRENTQRIETKPTLLRAAIRKILNAWHAEGKTPTISDISSALRKSPEQVKDLMQLDKIKPEYLKYMDDGRLSMAAALNLAKLPIEEQETFIDRATSMVANEFLAVVENRLSEIKKAAAEGRKVRQEQFTPVAGVRKLSDLLAMSEDRTKAEEAASKSGAQGVTDAFLAGIAWALKLDPESVELQKAQWEANKVDAERRKAMKEQEKANKKEAAEKAAAAQVA